MKNIGRWKEEFKKHGVLPADPYPEPFKTKTTMKREQFTVYSTGSKVTMDDLKANPVLVARTIADHLFEMTFEDMERLFDIRLINDDEMPGQTTIAVTITGRKSKTPKQGDEKIYISPINFL